MLKNQIPYPRLDQFEDAPVDNFVLTVRLGEIKLVLTTSYFRPDDIESLRKAMTVIQSCKTYFVKSGLNGALFVGDLNARRVSWGTNRVTCKAKNYFIELTTSAISTMVSPCFRQQMDPASLIFASVMGHCTQTFYG